MPVKVNVCICTYNRPSLETTLKSLAEQDFSAADFSVIVADNAETPALEHAISALGARFGLDLTYVHAPARNISIARNACLDAANAHLIAFIDDDEWASPGWLSALVVAAGETGPSVVLGPVRGIYGEDAPDWFQRHQFHDTYPTLLKGGVIRDGYTCNVLFRFADLKGLRFDLALGRSGGEDTDFISRLYRQGCRIAYCEAALVYEAVAPNRLSARWLLTRSFRSGQTHARVLGDQKINRPYEMALALSKFTYSLASIIPSLPSPARRMRAMMRASLHFGVVCRLAGLRDIQLY